MKSQAVLVALSLGMIPGCATNFVHLDPGPGKAPDDHSDLWPCVAVAYAETKDGGGQLTAAEQAALGGRDVRRFLDWSSFSGPRPVVWEGKPTAVDFWTYFLKSDGDPLVTQRYVLCLLRNGYQWPTEPVTEPPRSAPDPASPPNG